MAMRMKRSVSLKLSGAARCSKRSVSMSNRVFLRKLMLAAGLTDIEVKDARSTAMLDRHPTFVALLRRLIKRDAAGVRLSHPLVACCMATAVLVVPAL